MKSLHAALLSFPLNCCVYASPCIASHLSLSSEVIGLMSCFTSFSLSSVETGVFLTGVDVLDVFVCSHFLAPPSPLLWTKFASCPSSNPALFRDEILPIAGCKLFSTCHLKYLS